MKSSLARKLILGIVLLVICAGGILLARGAIRFRSALLIAHGGGMIDGAPLTNSAEAIMESIRKGYRFIEVDISSVSDAEHVLSHHLPRTPEPLASLRETARLNNRTLLDLEGLALLIKHQQGVHFITDVKSGRNVELLRRLRDYSCCTEAVLTHTIPQIYEFSEFEPVQQLGFKKVIYTNYRSPKSPSEILSFAATHSLFAISVPADYPPLTLLSLAHGMRQPLLVHTVNSSFDAVLFAGLDVSGFFTDTIAPYAVED